MEEERISEEIEEEEELPGTHTYQYKKDRGSPSSSRAETPPDSYYSPSDTEPYSSDGSGPGIIIDKDKKEANQSEKAKPAGPPAYTLTPRPYFY